MNNKNKLSVVLIILSLFNIFSGQVFTHASEIANDETYIYRNLDELSIEVDPEVEQNYTFGDAFYIHLNILGNGYNIIPANTKIRLYLSSQAIDYKSIKIEPMNVGVILNTNEVDGYIDINFNQDFEFKDKISISLYNNIVSNGGEYRISSELIKSDGSKVNLKLKDGEKDEILNIKPPIITNRGMLDPFWYGDNYVGIGTVSDGSSGGVFTTQTNKIGFFASIAAREKDVENIHVTINLDNGQILNRETLRVVDSSTDIEITSKLNIRLTEYSIIIDTGKMKKGTEYKVYFDTFIDDFYKSYETKFEAISDSGEVGGYPLNSGFKINAVNSLPNIYAKDLVTYENIPLDLYKDVRAIDFEDGDITNKLIINDSLVNWNKSGVYKLYYIVYDDDDNITIKSINVEVLSNDYPIISGCTNEVIKISEVDSFDKLKGVSANDIQDGNITSRIKVSGDVGKPIAGTNETYIIKYEVKDNQNNITIMKREITVTNQLPIIEGISDIVIKKGQMADLKTGVIASDYEDGNLTSSLKIPTIDLTILDVGIYELDYIVSDSDKNITTLRRKVVVKSNESPTISGINNITIKLNEMDAFDFKYGISVDDDYDNLTLDDISCISVGWDSKPQAGEDRLYEIVYSVTDSDGNKTKAIRHITVSNQIPIINGLSDIIIKKGENVNLIAGVTANDNEDGDLTKSITINGDVNINKQGEYEVVYTVTDSDGNSTIETRKVYVLEKLINNPPNIYASEISINVGSIFDPLKNVQATDLEDGDITNNIKVVENNVNTNKSGIYIVTYIVTDSNGVTTKKTILVNVEDVKVMIPGSNNITTPNSINSYKVLISEIYNTNKINDLSGVNNKNSSSIHSNISIGNAPIQGFINHFINPNEDNNDYSCIFHWIELLLAVFLLIIIVVSRYRFNKRLKYKYGDEIEKLKNNK